MVRSGTAEITVTDKASSNHDKVSVTVSDIFLTSMKIVDADTTLNMRVGEKAKGNCPYTEKGQKYISNDR